MADLLIAKLIAQLVADTSAFDAGLDSAEKRGTSFAGNMQKIGKLAMGGIAAGAGIAATAIVGTGAALTKLAIDAAPLAGIRDSFNVMADTFGVSLDAMKKSAANTIPDLELMKQANIALTGAGEDLGTEFGAALPKLLESARAAAKATGQDVGFLFESLVTGIKRGSPMLIDNTGLVLKLGEANEAMAAQVGKTVEELSAEEKQIAILRATVQAGESMVESFGGTQESAAEGLAQFSTMIQNVKDSLGMALLPTLTTVLGTLASLADQVLPFLVTFFETNLLPIIEKVADGFSLFVSSVLSGEDPISALTSTLSQLGFDTVAETVQMVVDTLTEFIAKAQEVLAPVIAFITQNVSLQDVLIGLGAAIAAVVIPAIIGIIAGIAPLIAIFAAVVAVVALLRAAWEQDFGGMRTFLIDFWENTALPAFALLQEWLAVNIPIAIAALAAFWTDTLQPALQAFWGWVESTVFPLLALLWDWLQVAIPAAIQTLTDFWQNTLLPGIQAVWAFIQSDLVPLFEALGTLIGVTVALAVEALAGIWQNVLQPALQTAWEFVRDKILPIFEKLRAFLDEKLTPAFDGIKEAIGKLTEFFGKLAESVSAIELPDWMKPGSPTPFEMGLRGIAAAMNQLASVEVPKLTDSLLALPSPGGNLRGSETNTTNFFNQTINTSAGVGAVTQGFDIQRSMVQAS